MKFQLFIIVSCIVCLSEQYGHIPTNQEWKPQPEWDPEPEWKPKPEPEWETAPPEWDSEPVWTPEPEWDSEPEWSPEAEWSPEPEWNPESEWNPEPAWEPESEWIPVPKPENICKKSPTSYDVEFTPMVTADITYDVKLVCDSTSKFRKLLLQLTSEDKITCNGVSTWAGGDIVYTVVKGDKNTETILSTNTTKMRIFNNGNMNLYQCGVISGGKCSGDILWGTAIFEADDQNGCAREGGVNGLSALMTQYEIIGKCASRCVLGSNTWSFPEPINNAGAVDRRSLVVEDRIEEQVEKTTLSSII